MIVCPLTKHHGDKGYPPVALYQNEALSLYDSYCIRKHKLLYCYFSLLISCHVNFHTNTKIIQSFFKSVLENRLNYHARLRSSYILCIIYLLARSLQVFVVRFVNYYAYIVVVYFILSRLLYLALSANLGLLCMPHPGMGPLI